MTAFIKSASLIKARMLMVVCIVLLLLSLSPAKGQLNMFTNFDITNGLSNNTTFCVAQGKKGFIWMGTADGLNRFDGKGFKVFRNFSNKAKVAGTLYVWEMLVHSSGALWLSTNKGVFVFNDTTEQLLQVKNVPDGTVYGMAEDPGGKVWLSLRNDMYECDPANREAKRYANPERRLYTDVFVTNNRQMWVGTESGELGLWLPDQRRFIFYPVNTEQQPASTRRILKIFDKGNGKLWVGVMQGVKAFNAQSHQVSTLQMGIDLSSSVTVRDFVQVNVNEYWMATKRGIYILDSLGRFKSKIGENSLSRNSLAANDVQALFKDTEGGIWCATYQSGISYYAPVSSAFEIYMPAMGAANSISGKTFTNITEDPGGNIWIAGDNGLNKFNTATRQFVTYSPQSKKGRLSGPDLLGLACDGNRLWIGAWRYGIDVMDVDRETITARFTEGPGKSGLKSNRIMSIYPDADSQTVWIGATDGMSRYNKRTGAFTTATSFPQLTPYNAIAQSADGTVWGLCHGLFFYNARKNLKGELKVMVDGENILPTGINSALLIAKDGSFWLGTGNGLIHVNPKNTRVHIYTTRHGLPSNIVTGIAEDNDRGLWVTTTGGVVFFNPGSQTVTNYRQIKGFFGSQFSYVTSYKARNGDIYIATQGSLIRVKPGMIRQANFTPPVYITSISMQNKPLAIDKENGPLKRSATITEAINFSYRQSSFDINFAALTYAAPEGVRYAYMMEGLDNDWHYIKSRDNVSFTGLPPGNYVFKVKSTNSRGIWQQNERKLKIRIDGPFYTTTWAYLLYTLSLALLVLLAFRIYKNRLAEKQKRMTMLYEIEKEKEIYASKTEFFTHVIHEIRAPVTLLKAPLEMAKNDSKDLPRTQKYLTIMEEGVQRAIQLINQLLTLKKTESAQVQLQPELIELSPLLESIYFIFDPLIKEKSIVFTSEIDKGLTHVYADREALTKMVTNLLDNAIKYGDGTVNLSAKHDSGTDTVHISVASNGPLIAPADREKVFETFTRLNQNKNQPGTGIGLALSKSLALLHRGNLQLQAINGLNVFILTLPAQPEKK
ncbi:ligand-binding sensor domain-containing protein [Niabella sp. 22666]|uniref:ligand-binding sensor domain-containing protein n=1 Tax=Niabella sp. 22666 TaxID=3453954 RepID=UPI003F879B61